MPSSGVEPSESSWRYSAMPPAWSSRHACGPAVLVATAAAPSVARRPRRRPRRSGSRRRRAPPPSPAGSASSADAAAAGRGRGARPRGRSSASVRWRPALRYASSSMRSASFSKSNAVVEKMSASGTKLTCVPVWPGLAPSSISIGPATPPRLEAQRVRVAAAADLHGAAARERVHDAHADAVQAARDL